MRPRAALAGVLAVLALAVGVVPAAAAGAAPAAAGDPLTVRLTRVSPTALTPRTPLTVAALVRNSGTTPVTSLRVTVRLSDRLTTRAEVTTWAESGDVFAGSQVGQEVVLDRPLAPGGTAPVTVTVPAARLGLDETAEQPEPHGLELRAAGGGLVARARSFVVWQPRPVDRPVQLTLLAPVTHAAATADAGAASAVPAADWSPSGRLWRLVQATSGGPFSYALDPALLSAATAPAAGTPATGPSTGSPTPSPSASPGSPTTTTAPAGPGAFWLQLLAGATRKHDVVALPWGDPDVAAVAHANLPQLVDLADGQARSTVTTVLHQRVGTLLWPAGGRLDTRALHALTTQPERPVLLDGAALPVQALDQGARVDIPVTGRRRGTRIVRATVSDPVLDRLVATGGAAAVPEVMADLAVTAAASPGRSVLVTLPRDWDPDPAAVAALTAAVRGAGWVTPTSFSSLAAAEAPGGARTLTVAYSSSDRRRELAPAHVAGVGVAQRRLAAFAPALAEPDKVVPALRQQALSLLGLGWRGQETGRLDVARTPLTAAVEGLYGGISIEPGSTKNLLAKEGSLPISVRNDLDYDVNLLLVLTPRTGQLVVPGAYKLHLDARTSQPVPVPVRAVANGDVAVVASFRTPDGRTTLYQSADIEVRVRSDWEGRGVLVVAVLLALLLAVGLARGVRRGRTRIPPEAVPDPDDIGRVPVPEPGDESVDEPDDEPRDEPREGAGDVLVPAGTDGDTGKAALAGDRQQEVELTAVPVPATVSAPTLAATVARASVVTASAAPAASVTLARDDRDEARPAPPPAPLPAVAAPPPAGRPPRGRHVGAGPGPADREAAPPPARPDLAPDSVPAVDAEPSAGDRVPSDAATRGILSSSAVMAAGTLMSRILGMVRVVVLAWAIGAVGFSANAFTTANTLPNQLFLLIGGGVLNAVLVPQIVGAMQRPDGGKEYVDRLLTLAIGLLAVATVVVTAAAPLLLWFFTSSWHGTDFAVAAAFAFWCMPQVFFYGLYTVLGQVLNARGSFGPYMWAPVVNNVVAIAGMFTFVALYGSGSRPAGWWTGAAIGVLAGTTTLGVVAQAFVLVPVLRRSGFHWRPRTGFRGVGLRSAGEVAGWTVAALVVGQLGLALLSQIANRSGNAAGGAGTGRFVYDVAFLLFMLPHSLVAVSVVTAVFTRMSHAVVAGRLQDVRADLSIALRTTGVATVLATVAFAVLGPDLTALLFATNDRATTEALAWTTTAMVVGLVPFSAQYLFQRVFYAFGDARTPFWVQVLVVTVWSAGNLFSGLRLEGAAVVVGIGASMSVANIVGAAVTVVLVRRRAGGVDGRRVASMYVRCAVAAVPAGVLAWATSAAAHMFAGEGGRGALTALVSGSLVLLVVYLAGLRLLRVRELDDLAAPLRRLTRA